MTNRISDYIARYHLARAQMSQILGSEYESDFDSVCHVDIALSESFDAILAATPESSDERLERLDFLLDEVTSCNDGNSLVTRLVTQIREDLHQITPKSKRPVLVVSQ